MAGLLCAFGWEMHRLSKSLEIRFWMASFSKMSLLTCPCSPCLRRKRVENSGTLDDLQKQHLDWKLLSLMFFVFSSFLKLSVWFMRLKFIHEQWSWWSNLQYYSIRFKKPLDIFWPQIHRKCSEDYLLMILAVNRKLWAIFLPRVHLEKEQTPGSRLKT